MRKRNVAMAVALIGAVGLSGCVSSSKYQHLKQDNHTLSGDLAALNQRYDNLSADKAQADRDLAALRGQAATLAQTRDQLQAGNKNLKSEIVDLQKQKDEELRRTTQTYQDLLEKMKGEISQGQVTISQLKEKLTVNLVDAILFDSGKAEVKLDGKKVLQKVVDILKTVQDKAIRVEGHTDNAQIRPPLTAKYPTNWELSAARAINVTRYLQKQGLDPVNLGAVAYSEYKPVASNDTPDGRAKNRRIEIILVPKE